MSEPELALGVIVCCRDEERVIERRLANLARSAWPKSSRPHAVVVVDDGSRDGTAKLAQSAGARLFAEPVGFAVIANRFTPGKSGAIASAVAHLRARVDAIVLTDADVVNRPDALVELANKLLCSTEIGMVTASQRFVRALRSDGSVGSATLRNTGGLYDRWTALMRGLESWGGRVFSVHGQLLAWREALGIVPDPLLAADDLDLMRQVRMRGLRVERSPRAWFFELKPKGDARRIQAVRRVRAYLQFAGTLDPLDAPDGLTRWQWRFYKHVPPAFPWIAPLAYLGLLALLLAGSVEIRGPGSIAIPAGDLGLILAWSLLLEAGRRLWWLRRVVLEAKGLEQSASLENRWSTAR